MELNIQSLLGLLCTAVLIGWDHRVHRIVTSAFWHTFSHEGKISLAWWGWEVHAHPLLLHLSPLKLQCTLQLSGQIHWPCFISCKDMYSVSKKLQPPPSPCIWAHIRGRYLSAKKDTSRCNPLMGPYAGVDYIFNYNLTLCPLQSLLQNIYHGQPHARVDLNPMPESTLSPCQGLWIWPLVCLKRQLSAFCSLILGGQKTGRIPSFTSCVTSPNLLGSTLTTPSPGIPWRKLQSRRPM